MPDPKLTVEIGAVITNLERNLAKAERSLQKFSNKTKALGKQFQTAGLKMSLALTAPLAILGGLAVKTAADFETLNTSLTTTFKGNEKAAKAAFKQIIEFAAKTPFQIEQVASAFIKLKNFGLDPSERALRSYGDTAAAMGKSLDQMVEAIADAATGEFERLKEFGIKASVQGDKVSLTFRGVTTTVKKEAAAIEQHLIRLGETEFAGGMEAQSKTFLGRLSTLKDNVAILSNEFGKILIEMINPLIDKIGMLAKKFQELSPATKKVIVVVGLVVAALGPLLTILGLLMTTVIPGLITVFAGLKIAVFATAGAFKALTVAMLANPVGLIITAITALTFAFVTMVQKITPAVSKLKTFINLILSAGDPIRFMNLQLKDQFDAIEAARIATRDENRELARLAFEQKVAAEEAAELTAELLKQAEAAKKVSKALRPRAENIPTTTGAGIAAVETQQDELAPITTFITDAQNKFNEFLLLMQEFGQQAHQLISGSIAETFSQLGEAIGEALATGGNVFDAIGQSILQGIGNFLKDFGKLMIQYGVAALAFSTATKALSNPITAGPAAIALIAAGAALTIIGSAISAFSKGGASGSFAGDTGGGGSRFATGSTTSNISGISGGRVVFEIAGNKLVGVLSNELSRNKALGGQNLIN